MLALWGWGRLVAMEIGPSAASALARTELDDNLRLLVLGSPTKNLGFFAYAVAPMSLATIAALVWIARERPRLSPGAWTIVAWALFNLAAFSLLGKGVARYLTPVWPACALLGALWLASVDERLTRRAGPPRAARAIVVIVLLAAALGQGWWYAFARAGVEGVRSPRALVGELLAEHPGTPLHIYDLACPALDYYAGARVPRWGKEGGRDAPPVAGLAAHMRETGDQEVLLLVAEEEAKGRKKGSGVLDSLDGMGLRVEPVATTARFRWSAAGGWFVPLRVSAGAAEGTGLP